jgi:RNA polymerase-binding transcription factor DksA
MNAEISHSDLAYFDQKLRQRTAELRQEIADVRARRTGEQYTQLAGEAHDAGDASVANLTMDTTSADIRRDEDELREVEEAIGRLNAGGFGMCLRCGQPIERARLEAYPAARRHVPCQEAHERENGTIARTPRL